MRRFSIFVLFFLLLMPVVMSVSNLTPLVHATTYNTLVDISSPIENKTYFTNDIPLSFNYSTDIIDSSEFGESHGVVFVYNVDGEVIFSVYGQAFFLGGKTTRIGQFYEPVPSDYSLYIDVPNGKHSVIVMVTFWFMREGELISIERISQTVNFTVSAEPPIPSESTIYIRADGSVEGTDKIQREGNIYTFLGNISIDGSGTDGIIVERDNIVIDGANFALQDESQTGTLGTLNSGIFLNQRNNVTVKNTQIMDFNVGIQITDSSNNFIENNQLLENKRGIDLYLSNDNKIFNNTLLNNYQFGILLRRTGPVSLSTSPRGNIVSNNTLQYNNNGINFEGDNIIKGNILHKNTGTAIEVNSYVSVTDNIVTENEIGIGVFGRNNVLKGNIMNYNSKFNFFMSGLRPDYYHTKDVSILVNDIDTSNTVNGNPIYYWIDKHDKIVPQNAGYIILVNCNNITVENQQLMSNGEGIVLLNTINSKVIRNTLQENNMGLGVFLSSNNLISQNSIIKNDIGIRIDDSFNNNITLNDIIQNNDWGIDFKGSQNNNYIYRNNFIGNGNGETLQVSMDKKFGEALENFWSPNNIGNYWSDYLERYPTATDDGKSVGDTPFYINENNIDAYPLMEPITIPEFPSWIILPLVLIATLFAVVFKKRLVRIRHYST